jgi:hypothetical protein
MDEEKGAAGGRLAAGRNLSGKVNEAAPDGRVNYPANFQVEEGINLFFSGDYLYWTAHEDGLYFAQTGAGHPRSGFDGRIQRIDPGWNSGMRLGAGLNFPKEGYDTFFCWTWFSAGGHGSAHSDRGTLLPLWAQNSSPKCTQAIHAKGKWEFDLQTYDLEWGRSSWFGGHLSLRPFFSLRAAWIDQTLKNHFTPATHSDPHSQLHSKSNFHGGGLRAGIDSRFCLPAGFAIYGLASGSLLYGQSDAGLTIHEEEHLIAHTRDKFLKGISSLQISLGAAWDTHFAHDRLHLEFHVGWEQNIWFAINQMNHSMHPLSGENYFKESSSLSTQGIVAGGRFDF